MRKIISIRIDPNVWKAARERGLNISRICERALISALQKGGNLGTVGSGVVGSPGFEPGSRTPEALSSVDWDGFEDWLLKSHGKDTAKLIMRYAMRYYWILWNPEKAGVLLGESKGIRRNTMIALANLSKYLGVYGSWKNIVKNYGFKWEKRTGLETVASLLNMNLKEVDEWLLTALRKLPEDYRVVLAFQALTGLRPSEAVESCRLVRRDLENYLNRESYGS